MGFPLGPLFANGFHSHNVSVWLHHYCPSTQNKHHQLTDLLPDKPVLTIGEQTIKRVSNKKVLGVIIDERLKWDKHNEGQCKTISRNMILLKKAKQSVRQDTLITMYNALVLPHFNYCSTLLYGMMATILI